LAVYRNRRSPLSQTPYHPIACRLHDSLELAAIRAIPVEAVYRGLDGALRSGSFTIRSIRSRNGAEWLVTDPPAEIRLDRIVSIDGASFSSEC